MRSVAQNLSERIGESPWLSELDDVSVGHGVSLLWWRSGGFEHPHDTPPYPFMPSPTSAHSSVYLDRMQFRVNRHSGHEGPTWHTIVAPAVRVRRQAGLPP